MKEVAQITEHEKGNSKKMLLAMVGIGVLSALLIVSTFQLTLPRVQRLKAEALEKAIFKVLPGTVKTEVYGVNNEGELFQLKEGDKTQFKIYAGFDNKGSIVGYAIESSGQGYADIIRILYGYNPNKEAIIGFQVLESKETPGLGDKIEKDENFLNNFKALDVRISEQGEIQNTIITVKQGAKENPWEIDGITGATISSRAVGNIIGNSTKKLIPTIKDHYIKNKQKLN